MSGCLAIGLFFMGIALLFIHPIIGVIFIFLASAVAASGSGKETVTYVQPEWSRTVHFGPNGPPGANDEAPLQIEGRIVFPSSIAKIHEAGPKAPDLETRKGITLPVPGTERPATLWVTLHSGDEFQITGIVADHLRECLDRLGAPKETSTGC